MVEEDTPNGLINNKFRNVKDKLRNRHLNNDTAWREAQPLFTATVEDYPEHYNPYLNLIRRIFDLRRNAYLSKIDTKEASYEVKQLIGELAHDEQMQIGGLVVCIRDLFDIPAQLRGKQKLYNKSLADGGRINPNF